ncbi:hypothetical protein AC579_7304 [Pseudocercospora musae]|uniref:Cyanovirin-N domain-containing protein n=1 Tax=Pseudocercospora musae TaxID=113226 RepID=A0A139I389_9PEZI|nr:hypothetical protein AC579_7304 [Pseudocercospora musae]
MKGFMLSMFAALVCQRVVDNGIVCAVFTAEKVNSCAIALSVTCKAGHRSSRASLGSLTIIEFEGSSRYWDSEHGLSSLGLSIDEVCLGVGSSTNLTCGSSQRIIRPLFLSYGLDNAVVDVQ